MNEILFEFIPKGRHVRVSAIDPETLTEIVMVGDARQSPSMLKALATKKLHYIINKQSKSAHPEKDKGRHPASSARASVNAEKHG